MTKKEEKTRSEDNLSLTEKIIEETRRHKRDTGSPEVQINILNKEIDDLLRHLSTHRHDNSSRLGLIKKISRRRKLLKYLAAENPAAYKKILAKIKNKK